MARAFRPPAASTARWAAAGMRTAIALSVIGAMSLASSAMLASPPVLPVRAATTTATAAAATGSPTGTPGTQRTRTDDVGAPGPTEPVESATPSPPPRCPDTPVDAVPATVVHHGSRTKKVVALTFDDGWNPSNVLKILAILQRAKVNATFFPTGQAIESSPATWRAVADAGFPVANHTYDHRRLKGVCYDSQLAEIARQDAVVRAQLGLTTQPYMRPPYGAYDGVTRLAATGDGEGAVVLWDVDSRDWSGISARAITTRALAGTDGSIIVMHTFVTNTVTALPSIIARYRARGFTFVTVGELLGIDGPTPFG